jgi:hypothetical protein
MRNHEVIKRQPLLNAQGSIAEPGWAKSLIWDYSRDQIKAPKYRIKEWDYYLVLNEDFAGAFTISDLGYMGMISASLLNFKEGWEHTESILTPFPMGRFKMSPTSEKGNAVYKDKRLFLQFSVEKGVRKIQCDFKDFYEGKTFNCNLILKQPEMDSMVIATPWKENKKAFYYNQKINCMPASGTMKFDGKTYVFNEETDFGTLDWGRGVWTYDNTWYWGSGNADLDGNAFGFNIGYGFGDTSAATENVIFYNGKAHKLDDVTFHIPESGYMDPWKFTSSDGRFEMDFAPFLDRNMVVNFGIVGTFQHQIFGYLNGTVILDDGTKLELKDFLCGVENIRNKY